MNYKIYRNDNYIFIDEVSPGTRRFSGLCSGVSVDNDPASSDVFTIRGVRGFSETLNLTQIKKEAGTAYTNAEFVDFYTQNTGENPDSSSALPVGAATSANQVTQIAQGTGVIDTTFSSPALPYTVPAGVNSFDITTQGSVAVDGITVPSGSTFSNSHPSQNGTVLSPAFTDVAAGSLLVILGIKI